MENQDDLKAPVSETQFLSKSHVYLLGNGPRYTIIEKVAGEFAGTWYEIGRGQGMTSKFRSAKHYARHNFERFIPKAVEVLTGMLNRQDLPDLMKQEIYDALMERANDPTLQHLNVQPNQVPTFNWASGKNPFLRNN